MKNNPKTNDLYYWEGCLPLEISSIVEELGNMTDNVWSKEKIEHCNKSIKKDCDYPFENMIVWIGNTSFNHDTLWGWDTVRKEIIVWDQGLASNNIQYFLLSELNRFK